MSNRKKRRHQPSDNTVEESLMKFKNTMGKRRRIRIRKRLNLRKRYPPTRQEKQRKTKFECCFLPLKKKYCDDIMSGKKKN